jgi:hypothetical protein
MGAEDKRMADKKTWTILLYLSSDNNLSEEGVYALKEIKKVGAADVNVFAQFDPSGRGNKTRRFLIDSCDPSGKLKDGDISQSLDEVDMSKPETLRSFIVDAVGKFPLTTNFMLILAGHGGGISEGFFLRDEERPLSEIPSAFPLKNLKDDVFAHPDVTAALGDKRKIDILGLDSCMMSMVEVCYEIRDCEKLQYVVASEGFSLDAGWPYERIVSRIKGKNVEPLALAKAIVEEHADFYADYHLGGLSTDLSVVKLGGIAELATKIGDLAEALSKKFYAEINPKRNDPDDTEVLTDDLETRKVGERLFYKLDGRRFQDSIILAHWAAQSYNGEQSIDLGDFCLMLQKRSPCFEDKDAPDSIYKHCEAVQQAILNAVEITCDEGAAFQFSRGVSISLPWSRVNLPPNYPTLRFSSEVPDWLKFIGDYADATQRLPRTRPQAHLRSTPPYSRGPEGRTLSMRNPPTKFAEHDCEANATERKR